MLFVKNQFFPFKDNWFNLKSQFSDNFFDDTVWPAHSPIQWNETSKGSSGATYILPLKRKSVSPSYLKDFHYYSLTNDTQLHYCKTPYPLSDVISYNRISPDHKKDMKLEL